MLKKSICCFVLLCILSTHVLYAMPPSAPRPILSEKPDEAQEREFSKEYEIALKLKDLHLFMGSGRNQDGSVNFELNRSLSRVEAIVMLTRFLGVEKQLKEEKTHPFNDVPSWADKYISYAYHHGITKGVSERLFGSNDEVTLTMYATFMLRALGYVDENDADFNWNYPLALANTCNILPQDIDFDNFLRADVVNMSCAMLFAKQKQSEEIYKKLIANQVFTMEEFTNAFAQNPFVKKTEVVEFSVYASQYDNVQNALDEIKSSYEIVKEVENPDHVVLFGYPKGTPHAQLSGYVVIKSNSELPTATAIKLAIPNTTGYQEKPLLPTDIKVLQNGDVYYSFYLNPKAVHNNLNFESGTFEYIVDKNTGKIKLTNTL